MGRLLIRLHLGTTTPTYDNLSPAGDNTGSRRGSASLIGSKCALQWQIDGESLTWPSRPPHFRYGIRRSRGRQKLGPHGSNLSREIAERPVSMLHDDRGLSELSLDKYGNTVNDREHD